MTWVYLHSGKPEGKAEKVQNVGGEERRVSTGGRTGQREGE